jgi:hypothetical protein
MKRIVFFLLVICAGIAGDLHGRTSREPSELQKLNSSVPEDDTFSLGDGRFEIQGRKPKGLTEFRSLYLEGAVLKSAPGRRLLPQAPGTVRGEIQGQGKFKLRNSRFEGEHLIVETAAVRGVSYKFEGKVSNYSPDGSGVIQPQFKGTLTRFARGKKAAEAQVTLVWIEPEF